MATTRSAPFPYYNARIDRLTEISERGDGIRFPYYEADDSLPVIDDDTYSALRRIKVLFPDANSVEPDSADLGLAARLEFFRDDRIGSRGVAIFNNEGLLIVHVLHALLGYNGSGPDLSRDIMAQLDVPRRMFDEIQNATWQNWPYLVVVSREQTEQLDRHTVVTVPGARLRDDWDWWRVR